MHSYLQAIGFSNITKEELDIQLKKATALRDEAVNGSLSKDNYLEKMIKI